MIIFLTVLTIALPVLAIGLAFWLQYRQANPKQPAPAKQPTTKKELSLPSVPWKALWWVGLLVMVGLILHHASREWIVETAVGTWQTQVEGKIYLPYDMTSLGGKTGKCLDHGVWKFAGVRVGNPAYQVTWDGKINTFDYFPSSQRQIGMPRGVSSRELPYPYYPGALLVSSSLNSNVPPYGIVATNGCEALKISANLPPNWRSAPIWRPSAETIFLVFERP